MSPLPPPPAGAYIPSDDWSDDPSFDLSSSPASLSPLATKFALPPSSPPSSAAAGSSSSRSSRSSHSSRSPRSPRSPRSSGAPRPLSPSQAGTGETVTRPSVPGSRGSRASLSSLREFSGSPLRQSFTGGKAGQGTADELGKDGGAVVIHTVQMQERAGHVDPGVGGEDQDLDWDVDTPIIGSGRSGRVPFPSRSSGSKPHSSRPQSGSIALNGTVVGTGPKGIGTITRLGGPSSGSAPAPPPGHRAGQRILSPEAMKSKMAAISRDWEGDIDFGDDDDDDNNNGAPLSRMATAQVKSVPLISAKSGLSVKRLTLSPPKRRAMPGPDALDGLDDFGNAEEEDEEEDREATLKAGGTIKALLPPPKHKTSGSGVGGSLDELEGLDDLDGATITKRNPGLLKLASKPSLSKSPAPPALDDDDLDFGAETDLVFPLNLKNLTLATQSQRTKHSQSLRPRPSGSPVDDADWDTPSTPSAHSGSASLGATSTHNKVWLDSSPSGPLAGGGSRGKGRYSETSGTSLSDDIATPIRRGKDLKDVPGPVVANQEEGDEEDMMAGLVLPSPTFFSEKRERELNKILDTKRKPQFAPSASSVERGGDRAGGSGAGTAASHVDSGSGRGKKARGGVRDLQRVWSRQGVEESMEDGLVLDEGGKELSTARLRSGKKIRGGLVLPGAAKSVRNIPATETGTSGRSARDREREKERDRRAEGAEDEEKATRQKEREAGWGRHTPLPTFHDLASASGSRGEERSAGMRERTQSSLGLSGLAGLRSHSASAGTTLPTPSAGQALSLRQFDVHGREIPRARAQSGFAMPPPPFPPFSTPAAFTQGNIPAATSSSSRGLRLQKSHYQLSSAQSPSLARKQSLSSLQDALASVPPVNPAQPARSGKGTGTTSSSLGAIAGSSASADLDALAMTTTTTTPVGKERYHHSTSRLTMPTSSSRAKSRAPVTGIFPRERERSGEIIAVGVPVSGSITNLSSRFERERERERERSKYKEKEKNSGSSNSKQRAPVQSQMTVPLTLAGRVRQGKDGVGLGRKRNWGDGTELEGIEDLDVGDESGRAALPSTSAGAGAAVSTPGQMALGGLLGLGKPGSKRHEGPSQLPASAPRSGINSRVVEGEKRRKSGGGSISKRRSRKPAGLIKHLGTVDKPKVVGDMTWNPIALRWEGNESILRDFDSIPTSASSTRPALITHYTGGSTGSIQPGTAFTSASASRPGSATGATATIRIVGDMKFDPERMCWVCLGEEEPDPFEGMADDEDEDMGFGGAGAGGGGGTITKASGRKLVSIGGFGGGGGGGGSSTWSSRLASESGASSAASAATTASVVGWDDRSETDAGGGVGLRDSGRPGIARGGVVEVSDELWRECREAEERHRREMKGWIISSAGGGVGMGRAGAGGLSREEVRERERREEKRLWEIRNLAMRS